MKRSVVRAVDALAALYLSSWGWLTPSAKLYKTSAWAVLVLLVLALVDRAFVLPAVEGWLAVVCLAGAGMIGAWMASRWMANEAADVPRKWIAPVRPMHR